MQIQPSTPTAAIYARVSTEDQAERQTIQDQLEFFRKYCDLHAIPVAGAYVDDGISGALPLDRRPEGRRLLDDAETGRFGIVLVMRVDRLARTLKTLLGAHDLLEAKGIALRSGTEPIDTSTPIGRFIFQLLGSFAEFERATITDRLTRGRDRAAKNGKYTGGPIPVGYDVTDDGEYVLSARLIPELGITEAELVRDLFSRIAAGSTLGAEVGRLNSLNVAPVIRYRHRDSTASDPVQRPRGRASTFWGRPRLSMMLHNPAYIGQLTLHSERGEITRPIPPLVDVSTWSAAHAALTRNRKLSTKNATHVYLLRGLLTCARCGRTFSGTTQRFRDGTDHRYYRCNGAVDIKGRFAQEERCRAKMIRADTLEAEVWADIRRFAHDPGDAIASAQRQLRERQAQSVGNEERRRQLLHQIAEQDTERDRILTLYRKGRISTEEAERQLDDIARESATLRAMVDSLRAQEALLEVQETHLATTAAMLTRLRDEIDDIERTNDLAWKQRVMQLLVRTIVIETEGEKWQKTATAKITYALSAPRQVVVSSTRTSAEAPAG